MDTPTSIDPNSDPLHDSTPPPVDEIEGPVVPDEKAIRRKNTRKTLRTVFQGILLIAVVLGLFWGVLFPENFVPAQSDTLTDNGFIAISYFGVDTYDNESRTLIYQKRLEEHLSALKAMGYVTISQQDILDYYENGTPLPPKALFLLFEDGRRDTANNVHSFLRKNNYIATVLTYADKFEKKDSKFLSPVDLKTLLQSSYWEHGTNGYRLEYINVYDRYRNFFGHLDSNEFVTVAPYLNRDYNHYLMDFLRDEDRLPTESLAQMQERIRTDYESMAHVYVETLGGMPGLYVLMHSNTGRFGNDPYVSAENEKSIREFFRINVNREGYCVNTRDSSIYDLTRMQPQANWYVNHLVMRICDDTGESPAFVIGDKNEAEKWTVLEGAVEFRNDTIVLTSDPDAYGRMVLPSIDASNIDVSVMLNGNVCGNQGIGLRADGSLSNAIYVSIENNILYVREIIGGTAIDIYTLDLFAFDGGSSKSVEEDERDSMVTFGNALLQYDSNYSRLQEGQAVLDEWTDAKVSNLRRGGEPYTPSIDLLDRGSRQLSISLSGDNLTLAIDNQIAIRNLKVRQLDSGCLYLESSALIQELYSQRNLTDDVYDAVYTDLTVSIPAENDQDDTVVLYEYRLTPFQKVMNWVSQLFSRMVRFFSSTF